MPTPAQIDEQIKLETYQKSEGLKRLRDNKDKLEQKNYASATIYGITCVKELIPLTIKRIEDTRLRIKRGQTGKHFKEINTYLANLEDEVLATIACKLTFDSVFGKKPNSNYVANVTESIGKAVEYEAKMRHYESKVPGLLYTLKKNYWHKSCGTQQKVVIIQTLMNRYGIEAWNSWTTTNRIKLGGWLLDCIMESSGWFFKELKRERRKTISIVYPTPDFLLIKDDVIAKSEMYSPISLPMLIEPNDWALSDDGKDVILGGYLLNEVRRGNPMVRAGFEHGLIQGEKPVEFLNKIQKVAYRLNPFTVRVSEHFESKGISIGKFIPIINLPFPPKPVDIEENKESRKAYRRAAAEVMNKNAGAFRRSCRTRMVMEIVRKFKDKEKYYLPWSFDYRGRTYPIPSFLTPQDTDWSKSLIRFADESPMTEKAEEWLAFQVATTYGLDKDTWYDRQVWVKNNLDLISKIALDPIDNLPDWEAASEPWQFLASCEEYYACVISQRRKTTGLCVAIDATCSGLQILAGLAKDQRTAQLVNVLPSDRPQDAYQVVADAAKPNIPQRLHSVWDRKCVKRTVMTIPYNAKPYSNRSYIRDALLEKGVEIDSKSPVDGNGNLLLDENGYPLPSELTIVVNAVREAMNKEFPGPMAVMKWIEKEVSNYFLTCDSKPKSLYWKTPEPIYFEVVQHLQKTDTRTVQLHLLGKCQIEIAYDLDDPSLVKHKAATAPNFIHSLDANLLHRSALQFNAPIALIHDSVLCRATDMTMLSCIVRENYAKLFSKDILGEFARAIGAKTPPPITDSKSENYLEPCEVIDSTYFFC